MRHEALRALEAAGPGMGGPAAGSRGNTPGLGCARTCRLRVCAVHVQGTRGARGQLATRGGVHRQWSCSACRPIRVPIARSGAGRLGPSAYGDPAVLAKQHPVRHAPNLPRRCVGSKTAKCVQGAAVLWLRGSGETWCRDRGPAVERKHRAPAGSGEVFCCLRWPWGPARRAPQISDICG